jgi:NAD(P)H-hydrate epimerase
MKRRYLSARQSRKIDQRAVDEFGMSSLVLMENAGRGCADVLCGLGARGRVAICCGKGNNGGDGLVMARHLDYRRIPVVVLLWSEPDKYRGDAAHNHQVLSRSDVPICLAPERGGGAWLADQLADVDWIVDALLGTGSSGPPRRPLGGVIDQLNRADARRFAIDLPSGLDCDSGQPSTPTFRADATCTFIAPKQGFRNPAAAPYLGRTYVADIGLFHIT